MVTQNTAEKKSQRISESGFCKVNFEIVQI